MAVAAGEYVLEDGSVVVDVECPNGHPAGKGHVATGYLGKVFRNPDGTPMKDSDGKVIGTVCSKCGDLLVPVGDEVAKKSAKGKKEAGSVVIDRETPFSQPGVPAHRAASDLTAGEAEAKGIGEKKTAEGKKGRGRRGRRGRAARAERTPEGATTGAQKLRRSNEKSRRETKGSKGRRREKTVSQTSGREVEVDASGGPGRSVAPEG